MIQTNVKSYLNFKVTLKKNTRRSQPVTHYRIPPPPPKNPVEIGTCAIKSTFLIRLL